MQELPTEIGLVLFDWDGTLANSVPLVTEATNAALREHGYRPVSVAEIHDGMRFPTVPRIKRHMGEEADARRAETIAASFHEKAMELGPAHIDLFPGVSAMLDALYRAGVPMGIVTNNDSAVVTKLVGHLRLSDALPLIIGEDHLPAPKPDPIGILRGCADFNVPPEQTLYVGDSLTDEEASRRAGVFAVGAAWPAESIVHATNNPYAVFFTTPAELQESILSRR